MNAPTTPRVRRAALAFIFVTVLIDVLSFGLIIPVLPHLIEGFVGGDTANAASWIGVFGTVFAGIQFITAPIQGALSDRFGRRPVILLSCLGLGLDFVFMALANTLPWLLVGRIISGITSASFTTANAYVADVTPPEKRAKSYGMIGAAFGLGFIVGPLLGGWLGEIHLRLPFWFAAGLALLKRYPQVFGLAAVVFIANLAHYVYPSIFVLFADYMYQWGPREVGWVLAAVGVCSVIVQGGLVGRIVHAIGERRALLLGLSCGMLGFGIYGFADHGWMFLVGIPISAIWGLAAPSTQALITRQVGPEVQGRIQGALMSLVSMAGIIGPGIFAGSFGWFIGPRAPVHLPGAPFLIAALLLGAAIAIAWRYARETSPREPSCASP